MAMEDILLRQMPHSLEGEQAVLGSMLIDPDCVKDVMDKLRPGDFYLSEFYFAKDSEDKMIEYLDPIIRSGGSGICILDEFVKELPDSVINYCNENAFTVILNSVNIPYAVMIREIMEMIILDGQNTLLTNGVYSIIENTIDAKSQLRVMYQINF